MPEFDGVGLITATIRTVEIILDIYKVLKDTESLPEAFNKVVKRLPLVQSNFPTIARSISTDADEENYQAIRSTMKKCKVKAEHWKEIFDAVASWEGTISLGRYKMATWRSGKINRVEVLTREMLEDVGFLVENRSVQVATQPRVALLDEAIDDLSRMPPRSRMMSRSITGLAINTWTIISGTSVPSSTSEIPSAAATAASLPPGSKTSSERRRYHP
ncbi:hypothetical protein FVEG_14892 [Fusarium verticillioides 7600]|uniref:NACHT-NTPase and P-loop NTPases N-terminal domain-containing protein n=1 Tax=Gibberella moniliformis (strain M3125 / FGSC 7600) TaxID=334819 RepID=W7LIV7_GIBM7|nr:hypothetical protein FVEG_14892 [Fusarium verticillioides 7600]EWG38466.1 hypothetical protein FVEG_14892 [Fusarium verticillioides 7600]